MFSETNQYILRLLNALAFYYLQNEKHKRLSPISAVLRETEPQFFSEISERTANEFFNTFWLRDTPTSRKIGVFFDETILHQNMGAMLSNGKHSNIDFLLFLSVDQHALSRISSKDVIKEWHILTEKQDGIHFTIFIRRHLEQQVFSLIPETKVGQSWPLYKDSQLRAFGHNFIIGKIGNGLIISEMLWKSKEPCSIHLNIGSHGFFDRGIIVDQSANLARHYNAPIGGYSCSNENDITHTACGVFCEGLDEFYLKVFPAWSIQPQAQPTVGINNTIEIGSLHVVEIPL